MKTFIVILFWLVLSLLLFSCGDEKSKYRFEKYFTEKQRETLMVDMVTLIGKKPKSADYITRHKPEHREYYMQLSRSFSIQYFHCIADTCYFYLIRPARSTRGNTRGVGGKLTLQNDGSIGYFEESFNTPVYGREELERIGWRIFRELIEKKSIAGLLWNVDYIEWPGSRLKYDTQKREWRYDVAEGEATLPEDFQ